MNNRLYSVVLVIVGILAARAFQQQRPTTNMAPIFVPESPFRQNIPCGYRGWSVFDVEYWAPKGPSTYTLIFAASGGGMATFHAEGARASIPIQSGRQLHRYELTVTMESPPELRPATIWLSIDGPACHADGDNPQPNFTRVHTPNVFIHK